MLQVEFYMCAAILFYSIDPCYYTYDKNYEEAWAENYAMCDEGKQQSPIVVIRGEVKQAPTQLQFKNFYTNLKDVELKNDGTKVVVKPNPAEENVPEISGSYLLRNYTLVSMEFHWGPNDSYGSEHTLNKDRYAMELQMYFIYKNYSVNASQYEDGMVAFAVFMKHTYQSNELQVIVDKLPDIKEAGETTTIESFPTLGSFMNLGNFKLHSTYLGSLTHPPCTEGIRWYIFRTIYSAHRDQFAVFRTLENYDGEPILSNIRNVQPLNKRQVIKNSLR